MTNLRHLLLAYAIVEDVEAGRANLNLCRRLQQVNAIYGRRCSLVELTGQILDSEELFSLVVALVGDEIGNNLSKYGVATTLHELVAKSEQIVNIEYAQRLDSERQVLVQLLAERLCLYLKASVLLDKYSVIFHILFSY